MYIIFPEIQSLNWSIYFKYFKNCITTNVKINKKKLNEFQIRFKTFFVSTLHYNELRNELKINKLKSRASN